jgi:hypothetical protein
MGVGTLRWLTRALARAAIIGHKFVTQSAATSDVENVIPKSMDSKVGDGAGTSTAPGELTTRKNCDGAEDVRSRAGQRVRLTHNIC